MLTLNLSSIQVANFLSDTVIELPTNPENQYITINLFASLTGVAKLNFPSQIKWHTQSVFEKGKVYKIILTYIGGGVWLGNTEEYTNQVIY